MNRSFTFLVFACTASITLVATIAAETSVYFSDPSSRADTCTADLQRCAGEENYPAVKYVGCCSSSTHSCVKAPKLGWGMFCVPTENSRGVDSESNCYGPGERCEGESGMPFVLWKPCCTGSQCKTDSNRGWGKFCVADIGSGQELAPQCTKTKERCAGAPGKPHVQYTPCCNSYDECVESSDLGWGLFCVPKTDSSSGSNGLGLDQTDLRSQPRMVTRLASTRAVVSTTAAPAKTSKTVASTSATTLATVQPKTVATRSSSTTTVATTTQPKPTKTIATTAAQPSKCGRVRKEIMDLTEDEWSAFVHALKTLRTKPGLMSKSIFDDFVLRHKEAELQWHIGQYFLPAHRMFLWELENELQKVSPGVTVPFHDWSINNKNWTSDKAWDRIGGLTGGALADPFQGWMAFGDDKELVTRTAKKDSRVDKDNKPIAVFESHEELNVAITRIEQSFADFSYYLEVLHGVPHREVGGTMLNGNISPSDPFFYFHHAFVDKIWHDWQASGNGDKFGGECRVEPRAPTGEKQSTSQVSIDEVLLPKQWNWTTDKILKEMSPCVTYQEPTRRSTTAVRAIRFKSNGATVQEKTAAAKLKESDGAEYKYRVEEVKVSEESFREGADFSGIGPDILERALKCKRIVGACAHEILPTDAENPDRILEKSEQDIEDEGKKELEQIEADAESFRKDMENFASSFS